MPLPSVPNRVTSELPVVAPGDPPHQWSLPVAAMLDSSGNPTSANLDVSGNLKVNVVAGGAGGGAVTVADGADVTQGALADAAVITDASGSLSAKLRGIIVVLLRAFALGTPLRVDPTGGTAQPVTGTVTAAGGAAAGAAPAGNPMQAAGIGRTTLPASGTAGNLIGILLDRYGRMFRISPILSNASSAGTAITTATNTSIVAAPAAGNHLRVHRLWAQNSSATGTWAYWGNGSGVKTIPFFLAQNQPMMMTLQGSWELSSVTALFMNTATSGANIEWYAEYETLAD